MADIECTSCSHLWPDDGLHKNCPRCRERKKYRKSETQKKYRDQSYDNPHRTEREVTLDKEIECPFCIGATTLRAIRDRQHKCWGRK